MKTAELAEVACKLIELKCLKHTNGGVVDYYQMCLIINEALLDAFKAGERFAAEKCFDIAEGDGSQKVHKAGEAILTDANNRTTLP